MDDFTDEEREIILNDALRSTQLRNFRKVLASSMPPHKQKKLEETVLPSYIMREYSARSAADKVAKKKGWHRR